VLQSIAFFAGICSSLSELLVKLQSMGLTPYVTSIGGADLVTSHVFLTN
jgi:hypothetical protein